MQISDFFPLQKVGVNVGHRRLEMEAQHRAHTQPVTFATKIIGKFNRPADKVFKNSTF